MKAGGPRVFKGDKWTKIIGSRVPIGATIEVVRYCYRRRVIIRYVNEEMMTMLWCLK